MKKIILILLICLILLNGCGPQIFDKTGAPEPGVTDYDPPRKLNLEVGQTASIEKLEIKLISAEKTKSYYRPDLDKMQKVKGERAYVLVEVELKNTHTESIGVGSNDFYILDDKGTRWIPGIYYGEDELEMWTELEPNGIIKGKFVFIIPETAEDFNIEYDITSLTW